MKTILTLILLIAAFVASAQKISFDNVSLKVPAGAVKLDPIKQLAKIDAISSAGSASDIPRIYKIHKDAIPNIYSIDNVIVDFWNRRSEGQSQSLEEIKSKMLGAYKFSDAFTVLSATIKPINGNDFLIINYQHDGNIYFRFYSKFVRNECPAGIMQYKKNEEKKAITLLEQILSGVSFEKQ